jgi:TRAP transporter 4TM/12TM fusion protein
VKLVEIAFSTGARRRPEGWLGRLVAVYAAGTALWVVYAATYALIDALALTIIFLTLMLVLVFLTVGATPGADRRRPPVHDLVLAAMSALTGLYFMVNAEAIASRMTLLDPLSTFDTLFASILLILTLETTRRTVGLGLTLIVSLFVVYNLFGDRFTGPLNHGVISTEHFLDIMVFTTDGIFGVPLRVAGTYVFLFVMFGTFLSRAGGSAFFFNLAAALSGRSPGGPAKIAVVSSGLYGTISGSPTSDVVTTGSVTIPMMQRLGYSGVLAGGVEVAASTGGSLLPPVMGSAAFIMAEYTGIDYVDIVIAALLPALLYYLCIYAQVHLRSLKMGLRGLPEENIPTLLAALKQGGLFLVPLAVVIVALIEGYSPTFVAVFGALSVLVMSWFRRDTRLGPKAVFESLAETSLRMVSVTGACAAAGLVIGGITMTGLAAKFSHLVFFVAGSDLFLSLLMAAALTLILGLGMPTPSAYVLAAVLVGPLLEQLGVPVMAGHMFLLYFAVMSAMTPPVAVAAYAASAIAEANPLRIVLTAVRLSLAAYIVPFAFVFGPGLLMVGSVGEIAWAAAAAAAGLILLAIALEGFIAGPLYWWERVLAAGAGLSCLTLSANGVLIAAALALAGLARSTIGWWRRRRAETATAEEPGPRC